MVEAGLDNGSVTPDIAVGNCLLKLPGQILEHAPEMHPSIMENLTENPLWVLAHGIFVY